MRSGVVNNPGFDRARRLLACTPLVDGHNDLPWALREKWGPDPRAAVAGTDLSVEQPDLHTDLVKLRRGGVGAQFWSVYVPCQLTGHSAVTAVLEQIEIVHGLAARYPDDLRLAYTADQAESAFADGRVASLLGAEGGHCIAESLGVLRALHRLGVRYMTLTHNDNTPWADSATDEPQVGGLSDFGREVVAEMNRLGMLVDLSHVAATTMRDALDVSTAPVIFSHSSCRTITDHPRNVPDDVLKRLPDNGGVLMVTFVPRFISPAIAEWDDRLAAAMEQAGEKHADLAARERFCETWEGRHDQPQATLAEVVAHFEHARDVVGVDHIGVGGDYDGCPEFPADLENVGTYPALFAALLDAGWSEDDCAKVAGRNVLRALRWAERVAAGRE
ncbi:membrane dipeptidase [Actinokineospora sp. HBU206404]|uniref:Membrane dipeptidase n=1 Tax=Actinokineospora xionganensis TaxID=2684470 RepID=A0ABR7L9W0_9PSEU|nr:dipeptidase [Actinokineospora xionganensis]MBC6449473.1 membrane dipeptidase [Actinokineospora xionganensis]